jgi:hypothetical protein
MYALQLSLKPLRLDWQIDKSIKTRVERSLQLVSHFPVAARDGIKRRFAASWKESKKDLNLTSSFHSNPIYVSENSLFRNTYPDQLEVFSTQLKHMAVTKGS